jgi:hypothetical protein
MDPPSDPAIRQQVEEFHRRLAAMHAHHQRAAVLMAADSLARSLDVLNKPVEPRRPMFYRVGRWFARRVATRLRSRKKEPAEEASPAVVIDATYREVSEKPSSGQEQEAGKEVEV